MKKKVLLLIALLLPLMACAQVTKAEEADTLNEKAYEYAYEGNFEAALATIDKAIKLCPESPDYYDSKGEILFNKGDKDGAKKMWDKVISLDPNYSENKTALYVLLFNPEIIEEHDSDLKTYEETLDRLLMWAKGQDVKIEENDFEIVKQKMDKIRNEYEQLTFIQKDQDRKVREKLQEFIQVRKQNSADVDADGWKYKTSKGYIVQYSSKDSREKFDVWIIYPDSIKFRIQQDGTAPITSYKYFKSKYESTKEIPKGYFKAGYISSDISKLPDNEIAKIIREKVIELFGKDIENTSSENGSYFYWSSVWLDEHDGYHGIDIYSLETEEKLGLYIGKQLSSDNDRYVSEKKRKADIEAKEKAKEKALQAKLAPYIRRFGFNPSGKSLKQLVTVGRSFSLLNDYFHDYYIQGSDCFFSFAEDTGISKGYRVVKNRKRVGYVYVQRDRIISVTWY